MKFDEFLAKLSAKDRVNAERRVAALDANSDPARTALWKQLACTLMTFAPLAAKFVGKQTVQFYIPDGRYRMQVFALEDPQNGLMTIYCPDILSDAMNAGLVSELMGLDPHMHRIEESGDMIRVEPLDKDSTNAAAHFKDMVGWNRKALRITLPPIPTKSQVETAELLCAIAAQQFTVPPPSDTTETSR